MFIFAHVFAGALLGLGFWHLTNDRRAIPVCIAGSILPDVIDKSLGLLFHLVLGGGRTVFHSLMIIGAVLLCMLLFARSRFTLSGAGVAGAILLHQVFDEMWNLPANWFYPFLGPFQGRMIPDYVGTFFWLEITNPSEWLFMIGSVMIVVTSYQWMTLVPAPSLSDRMKTVVNTFVVVAFWSTGLYLVTAALMSPAGTFITPSYNPITTMMAGALALCGAVIIFRRTVWHS